jgi:phosphatidylinositol phospholipase C delta
MAALNWQTFDLGMQINQAMFQGGRDCSGYVLKPNELRDIQVLPYNSAIAEGKKERSVVSFSIDVISAQQLMRPANLSATKSMDPYVSVEIFHANDKRDKIVQPPDAGDADSPIKFSTDVVRENGFNPVFSNSQFKFKVTTKHPELIFVRWSVRLSNDREGYKPAIASYTAKLCNLKHGFRTLPLLNHMGDQYLFSTLFCKIQVDPIEKRLIDIGRPGPESSSKLNRLGGKVFGRINSSPRGTIEAEKRSFEGHP